MTTHVRTGGPSGQALVGSSAWPRQAQQDLDALPQDQEHRNKNPIAATHGAPSGNGTHRPSRRRFHLRPA
ncbi:hypothetical protein XAC2852_190032 [Xanthomonas citri pv. citri]|nr:hypothetical protein XAC1083_180033 [Xanthomonas citri pv. citri]CEE29806.1 hypothetical protein XAC2911_160033 [Xanthomonas citri pv. citri]CEE53807.1 hypothetical protein XAC71A_210033 [Xanthomonas citri pv. citri]CEE60090.1 hypothetical protein XACS584_240033 [Xanthomonas citri pv. citri]CEE60726.1 hypothetical protein XAC2852_190032 [Xanthomonas citri pv. citri]